MWQWLQLEWLLSITNSLSTSQLALWCSMALVTLTWFGIIFIKPILRIWVRKQPGSNDLINYASAGFSLFYGLLLGLLSVAAYDNITTVERQVDQEVASISALYATMASFPEPIRGDVQRKLRDYTLYIINKDWPAHTEGKIFNGGGLRLNVIAETLSGFEAEGRAQTVLQEQALKHFDEIRDARQSRLAGVRTAIPGVLWYVVAIGALINILLIWLLDARFVLHLMIGGIISFFLGVIIFLVMAMDRPLQGSVRVSEAPYRSMYERVMQWDEGL
jgi:hypothetical protein